MATIHIQQGGVVTPPIVTVNKGEEVKFQKNIDQPVSIHFLKHDGCFSKLPLNDINLPNRNEFSIGIVTDTGDKEQPFIVTPPGGGQDSPPRIIKSS